MDYLKLDNQQRLKNFAALREKFRPKPPMKPHAYLFKRNWPTDPNHVDYHDPKDGHNTRLNKVLLNKELSRTEKFAQVRRLIEQEKANPCTVNIDSFSPLGLARNIGEFEIAEYLRVATDEVWRRWRAYEVRMNLRPVGSRSAHGQDRKPRRGRS